ncbi:MAG: glycosyltransferase family 4 protein [Oceanihabitans sp.]
MKKNIAIIASVLHPIRQRHLINWYQELAKEPLLTKLFVGSKKKNIPFATNYKVNTKKEKLIYVIYNILKLNKTPKALIKLLPLVAYKPKVIHLLTSNTFSNIEPLLAQEKIKLIVSFRGYDINVFPHASQKNKQQTQAIFNKADVLHFVSEDLKNKAIKLHADATKCVVINRSIDIQNMNGFIKQKPENKKPIILTVGRMVWEKGYVYALETMFVLKQKGIAFEYHIAGDGVDKAMLEFHVKRLELEEVVVFKGELSHNAVKQTMVNADIYFQPSIIEGIPNSIFEAAYFKLPIVASQVGGIPEVITHELTGLLSPSCQPVSFAKNLLTLLENKALRTKMGANAQQHIIDNFTRKKEIEKWLDVYRKLMH